MVLRVAGPQQSVEGRFRREVAALIGQSWHDLTRRQMGMGRLVTHGPDPSPFLRTQAIPGDRPGGSGPRIRVQRALPRPALNRAERKPQLLAGSMATGSGLVGLGYQLNSTVAI
jgi:hypothetical protein